MDSHTLPTELESNSKEECIQGRTVACLWNTYSPSIVELWYRVDSKAAWESLCFNSLSVVGRANASKWKTWQWVRFPAAGFNLHLSFSTHNKALELLFFAFEFSFCANTLCEKTVEDRECTEAHTISQLQGFDFHIAYVLTGNSLSL